MFPVYWRIMLEMSEVEFNQYNLQYNTCSLIQSGDNKEKSISRSMKYYYKIANLRCQQITLSINF